MESIIAQVRELARTADHDSRKKLLDTLKDLHHEIETPFDALWRFYGLQLQITMARVGIDSGIFEALAQSKAPLYVEEIALKNGGSPELLGRILRYLASQNMIKETGKNQFTSSNLTPMLADHNYQGGIYHFFDTVGPPLAVLPDVLLKTNYADITDNTKTALQPAFKTELPGFVWFTQQPKLFQYFQRFMVIQRQGAKSWLSAFPFKKELGSFAGETVLVDVGGGFGHQCIALMEAFPELAGKLELQDLPQALQLIQPIPGVRTAIHNFFEPQRTKGAKFYYLRNILHDWPDDKSILILKNLIPALGPESRILIDDMVFPDQGVNWVAAQQDLIMMSSLGSKERTKSQWTSLLDQAGFVILDIYEYAPFTNDSIVVAALK